MRAVDMLQILENTEIATDIFRMKLYSPGFSLEAQPGQFFHIRCGGEKFPLLRRPISLSYRLPKEGCFVLVYRVEGQGTAYLSRLRPGDSLDVMGPLGKGFYISEGYQRVLLVGGGMGIAPLVELAGIYKKRSTAFLGYRDQTFLLDEFSRRSGKIYVTTESGREGCKGFVTDLLVEKLKEECPDIVYCCGPRPMMKKVLDICRERNIRCQVSLEERMGCGIGACLVCSCATRDGKGGKTYSRVCKDGPVFWGEEVLLDG